MDTIVKVLAISKCSDKDLSLIPILLFQRQFSLQSCPTSKYCGKREKLNHYFIIIVIVFEAVSQDIKRLSIP